MNERHKWARWAGTWALISFALRWVAAFNVPMKGELYPSVATWMTVSTIAFTAMVVLLLGWDVIKRAMSEKPSEPQPPSHNYSEPTLTH